MRAWALGDAAAFVDAPTTLGDNRRLVLAATGIDIANPFNPDEQRSAVLTIRRVLAGGIGFKAHPKTWERLKLVAIAACADAP